MDQAAVGHLEAATGAVVGVVDRDLLGLGLVDQVLHLDPLVEGEPDRLEGGVEDRGEALVIEQVGVADVGDFAGEDRRDRVAIEGDRDRVLEVRGPDGAEAPLGGKTSICFRV